jgi:hypothetical protein
VGSQSLSGRVKRYSVVGPRGQTGLRPCVGSSSSLGTLRAVRECLRPRCQTELRPCVQSLTPEGEDVATSEAGVRFSERSRRSAGCRSSRPTWLRPGVRSGSFSHGVERKRALWVLAPSTMGVPLSTFCEATRTPAPRSASLAAGATTQRPTPPGPQRTFPLHAVRERSANPRMSEALVGRQDLTPSRAARTLRERSRTHAWAKPVGPEVLHPHVPLATSESDCERTHGRSLLGATTYTLTYRSQRSENDHERTHGRSPVWRADPRRSYERSLPRRTPRVAARLGWSFLITP